MPQRSSFAVAPAADYSSTGAFIGCFRDPLDTGLVANVCMSTGPTLDPLGRLHDRHRHGEYWVDDSDVNEKVTEDPTGLEDNEPASEGG